MSERPSREALRDAHEDERTRFAAAERAKLAAAEEAIAVLAALEAKAYEYARKTAAAALVLGLLMTLDSRDGNC